MSAFYAVLFMINLVGIFLSVYVVQINLFTGIVLIIANGILAVINLINIISSIDDDRF